jgi:hypothetical protein
LTGQPGIPTLKYLRRFEMKETLIATAVALALSACGGGGGGGGGQPTAAAGQIAPANAPANSATPAPASAAAPAPALLVQPASMVNTTTAGQQIFSSISAQTDGGYTVSWISGSVDTSNDAQVFIQRYSRPGNKVAGETSLAIDPPLAQGFAVAVATLTNGETVVARANPVLNGAQSISLLRFNAGGALIGQTEAASIAAGANSFHHIDQIALVPLANGGLALGWDIADIAQGSSMFTQRLDRHGLALGDPVEIANHVGGRQSFPSIRLTPDLLGGYTLQVSTQPASAGGGPFGELSELEALVHFDANGTKLQVGPVQASATSALLVPLADGRFVLFTLDNSGSSPTRQTLSRQFLDSAGNRVGEPVVTTFDPPVLPTFPSPLPVAATALADGSYVVFSQADGGGFTAQRFDANGAALGDAVAVGSAPAAALPGGGIALAWSATGSGGDADVFTERVLVQN